MAAAAGVASLAISSLVYNLLDCAHLFSARSKSLSCGVVFVSGSGGANLVLFMLMFVGRHFSRSDIYGSVGGHYPRYDRTRTLHK